MSGTPPIPLRVSPPRSFMLAAVVLGVVVLLWLMWGTQHTIKFDGMQIRGTWGFRQHVVSALTLLKTRAPEAYGVITNYIGVITQSPHTGMAAYESPPKSYLHDKVSWESIEAFAAGIAHESFHSKLYLERQKLGLTAAVPDDAWTGENAEKLCCQHQAGVLRKIGGSKYEIDYYDWDPIRSPTNRYWEVPYEKRDW